MMLKTLLSQQALAPKTGGHMSFTAGIFHVTPGRPESRPADACMGMSSANRIMLLLSMTISLWHLPTGSVPAKDGQNLQSMGSSQAEISTACTYQAWPTQEPVITALTMPVSCVNAAMPSVTSTDSSLECSSRAPLEASQPRLQGVGLSVNSSTSGAVPTYDLANLSCGRASHHRLWRHILQHQRPCAATHAGVLFRASQDVWRCVSMAGAVFI